MATLIYLPSSGSPDVTPSSWIFPNQINPLTLEAVTSKISSAFTTKTEATGGTSPTTRAMLRYVIGPLTAQTISGTVRMVMRARESNAGANANLAMAVKIIQSSGADRATLLGVTSSDSTASPYELTTTLASKRVWTSTETEPLSLTQQDSSLGDYLVIEIGFRSATTNSRNIDLRYGDNSSSDLTYGDDETNDYCPWVELSGTISFASTSKSNKGCFLKGGIGVKDKNFAYTEGTKPLWPMEIGWESGNSEYPLTTESGLVAFNGTSKRTGNYGMDCNVIYSDGVYSPDGWTGVTSSRNIIYIYLSSLSYGGEIEGTVFEAKSASGWTLRVLLTINSSTCSLRLQVDLNSGYERSSYVSLNQAEWIKIDVAWGTGSGDGWAELLVNDSLEYQNLALTNSTKVHDNTNIGTNNLVDATGHVYYDDFTSSTPATPTEAGTETSDSSPAYTRGSENTSDDTLAFTQGSATAQDNQIAFLHGAVEDNSSVFAFLAGISEITSSFQIAFLKGSEDTTDSNPVFLKGKSDVTSSKSSYTDGESLSSDAIPVYLAGGLQTTDSQPAFTEGEASIPADSSKTAFINGISSVTYLGVQTGIAALSEMSFEIYKPAYLQEGDLCICFISMVLYQLDDDPVGWTVPDGWTHLETHRQQYLSTYFQRFKVYYYYATASEPEYWQWYYTSGSNHAMYAGCVFLREYGDNLQIGHRGISIQGTSTVDNIAPAIATLRDNEIVFHVGSTRGQRTRTSTGYTEVLDTYYPNSTTGANIAIAYKAVSTPQTVDSFTATYSSAQLNMGYHIAVRPDKIPFGILSAFAEGWEPTSSLPAYINGYVPVDSRSAYLKGSSETTGSKSAFLNGGITATGSKSAYAQGSATYSSIPAFLEGSLPSVPAFLSGIASTTTNLAAYTRGASFLPARGSVDSFTRGVLTATPSSLPSFIFGGLLVRSSKSSFVTGYIKFVSSRLSAYIGGTTRSSKSACVVGEGGLEEDIVVEYAYITLQTSDGGATINKRFRVVAQDYNDGGLEKQTTVNKTIGGGIDAQMGAVYRSFNPTIRVRHTEVDSNYGVLSDLESLFNLTNPGATPSNLITYIDHHGTSRTCLMVGNLQKSVLGCRIEGTEAWYIVRCNFIEVPA